MMCPRCQGLIVVEPTVTRCLNCGYRPIIGYVVPPKERMNRDREQAAYTDSPTVILRRKLRKARRAHA